MDPMVKKQFDNAAGDYDRQRRQLIPCFDDFYGMALSLVESDSPAPEILDLGAGTGLFSEMVKRKLPHAQLTLMDVSDKMLDGARTRFQGADGIRYVVADYSNRSFAERYDIVVSSLSIHHLPHPDKRRLFASIYEALRPGGVFVNADQVRGNTERSDAYYRQRWLAAIHATDLPKEAIEASVERRKLDINATAAEQIGWLEEAGFAEVDCMYKYFDFAVFFGRKAEH